MKNKNKKIKSSRPRQSKKDRQKKEQLFLDGRRSCHVKIGETGDTSLVRYVCDLAQLMNTHPEKNWEIASKYRTIPSLLALICRTNRLNTTVDVAVNNLIANNLLGMGYDYDCFETSVYDPYEKKSYVSSFDSCYERILRESWPDNIYTASNLRHWFNVWGDGPERVADLAAFFNTDVETIRRIREHAHSRWLLRDALRNIDTVEEEYAVRRKAKDIVRQRELSLLKMRQKMCGVGSRKVKCVLNRYVNAGDPLARALRFALEAEDASIRAKMNPGYAEKIYNEKDKYINALIGICRENGYTFGVHASDVPGIKYIIYFDLPDCEQISYHFAQREMSGLPVYKKQWDGKENSVLGKLEKAISIYFQKKGEKIKFLYELKPQNDTHD